MTPDIRLIYTPTERAVLGTYLGFTDPAPIDLADIDVLAPVDPEQWDESIGGVAPLASETGSDRLMLENAVARICLQPIRKRLPEWASISAGTVTLGRRRSPPRSPARRRRLRPRHLFTINWGDSGPGFSWPEAYYITRLPGYDVAVVTASADSPDTHGYCDLAIGQVRLSRRTDDEIRECVIGRWSELRTDCCQERWAYLFETGAVDKETAEAWRELAWPDSEERDY